MTVSESRESLRWFATVLGVALIAAGLVLVAAAVFLGDEVVGAFSGASVLAGAVLAFAGAIPVDDRP